MAAQVDDHRVLARVQKVNLQCYQLGEPVTVQGLSHTRVLRDKGEEAQGDYCHLPCEPASN